MAKKVLKIVGGVLGALVLIVVIYVVYVMASYYRLDDSLSLETAAPEEGQVESVIELDADSQEPAQEFTIVERESWVRRLWSRFRFLHGWRQWFGGTERAIRER